MVRAKVTASRNYGNRRVKFRPSQTTGDENRPPLRIGNRTILHGRVRKGSFKIKKLLDKANFKVCISKEMEVLLGL